VLVRYVPYNPNTEPERDLMNFWEVLNYSLGVNSSAEVLYTKPSLSSFNIFYVETLY
jgi:hypothetical protein